MEDSFISSEHYEDMALVFGILLFLLLTIWLLIDSARNEKKRRYIESRLFAGKFTDSSYQRLERVIYRALTALIFLIPGEGKERDEAEQKLRYAGFRTTTALTAYYLFRLFAIIVLPSMVYFGGRFVGTIPESKILIFTAGSFLGGLLLSGFFLQRMVNLRQGRLRNALPDALDLLVVCSEAGLGLNAALIRVSREIRQIHPDLASEFGIVNSEIQGGMDREMALKNMIFRTGLMELKALVMVINQTMKLGTSISQTLRVYSEEWRDQRMQAAEEKAAKVSTQMIFPLVLCFLPCFFIVAIGPSGIKLMSAFH